MGFLITESCIEKPALADGSFGFLLWLVAPAAAVSTTESTTAACATRRTLGHGARLVYGKGATFEVLAIEHFNSLRSVIVIRHFDESETLRPARHLVHDDHGRFDGTSLRKRGFQGILSRRIREAPDV
jgi:hypothetical protein